MSLANFTFNIVECYPEWSKFSIETGPIKFGFTLSGCMHPEDEMETFLQGKDYKYSDCELTIDQKDGTTTFTLATDNGTDFNISIPSECCLESLRKWVYACQDAEDASDELPDDICDSSSDESEN